MYQPCHSLEQFHLGKRFEIYLLLPYKLNLCQPHMIKQKQNFGSADDLGKSRKLIDGYIFGHYLTFFHIDLVGNRTEQKTGNLQTYLLRVIPNLGGRVHLKQLWPNISRNDNVFLKITTRQSKRLDFCSQECSSR